MIESSTIETESLVDIQLEVTSPGGEKATFDVTFDRGDAESKTLPAVSLELDDALVVDYSMKSGPATALSSTADALGPDEMTVHYAGLSASGPALPGTDPATHGAYELAVEGLQGLHSASFYSGAQDAMAEYAPQNEAFGQCVVAILAYLVTFAGLASCGSVVLCLPAITAHYLAIAGLAGACTPLDF